MWKMIAIVSCGLMLFFSLLPDGSRMPGVIIAAFGIYGLGVCTGISFAPKKAE
jgi:hypothetical protein